MDNKASIPSKLLPAIGTPITGKTVWLATTPGRAAAIPAAVIITSVPSVSVSLMKLESPKCALWADKQRTFTSTP